MNKTTTKKPLKQIEIFCLILGVFLSMILGCNLKKENLNIIFAGDLMLDRGTRKVIEVHGVDYIFDNIQTVIGSSDFAVANFECVSCDSKLRNINKKFSFRANPEWLTSLYKNGITHLTIANNHSFDFGEKGVIQTVANLNRIGIKSIGYCRDSIQKSIPTIINKNNNTIAVFSSCFLKQNNKSICSENAIDLAKEIKTFKSTHPSCIIIVCLHWGVEMELKPTLVQIDQAHLFINSGADVIIGHHPHVVQTIEIYKRKYIFYSLGNFIFDSNHEPANHGILTDLSISKGKINFIQIIPFNIVKSKPQRMNNKESDNYRNEIEKVSNSLELKQSNGIWKVL